MIHGEIMRALGGHLFVLHCVHSARPIERGTMFELQSAACRPRLDRVTVTSERNDGLTMRSFRQPPGCVERQVSVRHEIDYAALPQAWHEVTGMDPARGWIGDAVARVRSRPVVSKSDMEFVRRMRLENAELALAAIPMAVPLIKPPRLLVMACSATKDPSPEQMTARRRYRGPLWTTLAAADPDGSRCVVAYVSAKHGLGEADWMLDNYEQKMTRQTASHMIERGVHEGWPPQKGAYLKSMRRAGPSPMCVFQRLSIQAGRQPFADIALVGGEHYVAVMGAYVAGLQKAGQIPADARITIINDQIGFMRQGLRRWLDRDRTTASIAA